MRVRLTHDLWITQAEGGIFELGPPMVVRRDTGESVPGAVTPRPLVFKAGAFLDIIFVPGETAPRTRVGCRGCAQRAALEAGETILDLGVVLVHDHAP